MDINEKLAQTQLINAAVTLLIRSAALGKRENELALVGYMNMMWAKLSSLFTRRRYLVAKLSPDDAHNEQNLGVQSLTCVDEQIRGVIVTMLYMVRDYNPSLAIPELIDEQVQAHELLLKLQFELD